MHAIRLLARANFAKYDRLQKRDFHQVHSSVLMDQASITAASKRFREFTFERPNEATASQDKAAIEEGAWRITLSIRPYLQTRTAKMAAVPSIMVIPPND
ncbi:hypothetical protein MY5147_006512 [Beauveria neobassiana]